MSGKAHPPRGVRRRKRSTGKGQKKAFNVKRGAAGGAEDGRRVRLLCRASRANLPQSFRAQSSPFMLCVCRRLCASSVSTPTGASARRPIISKRPAPFPHHPCRTHSPHPRSASAEHPRTKSAFIRSVSIAQRRRRSPPFPRNRKGRAQSPPFPFRDNTVFICGKSARRPKIRLCPAPSSRPQP